MSAASISLAVVMPTHNRRAILDRALSALEAQSQRDFRVVVVDDGSSDGTSEWLAQRPAGRGGPELVALRQEASGQGRARNLGLRVVDEELVLFLGDDILAGPELVAEHRAAHATARTGGASIGVVGFTDWRRSEMRVTPALEMANREGHQFGFGHMVAGARVPFTCFYTSNLSVPRSRLGADPFAAEFTAYGWEDVELGYRLEKDGLELRYHPQAAAEHLHPMSLADLYARQVLVGRGRRLLDRLHAELATSPLLAPPEPPRWFAAGRRLLPPLVPWFSRLDDAGWPLGERTLHRILLCGYYLGQQAA